MQCVFCILETEFLRITYTNVKVRSVVIDFLLSPLLLSIFTAYFDIISFPQSLWLDSLQSATAQVSRFWHSVLMVTQLISVLRLWKSPKCYWLKIKPQYITHARKCSLRRQSLAGVQTRVAVLCMSCEGRARRRKCTDKGPTLTRVNFLWKFRPLGWKTEVKPCNGTLQRANVCLVRLNLS